LWIFAKFSTVVVEKMSEFSTTCGKLCGKVMEYTMYMWKSCGVLEKWGMNRLVYRRIDSFLDSMVSCIKSGFSLCGVPQLTDQPPERLTSFIISATVASNKGSVVKADSTIVILE